MWHTVSTPRKGGPFDEDSCDFKPERWEDRTNASWAYLPFNGRPRVCLGREFCLRLGKLSDADSCHPLIEGFGLTLATYTVVRILQTFSGLEAGTFLRPQEQEWLGWS